MAFTITIDQFEGPLDLMLHLIKDNKLDLFDLDMNVLTTQYLNYLKTMEAMHLEVASEYLSELASLVEYKSKKLLPREKVVVEEEYEEDHKERLVKRLLEYQRYKEVSETFHAQYEERLKLYSKPLSKETSQWMKVKIDESVHGNPYDLIKAMERMLRRQSLLHPLETKMKIKELSVDDRVIQIKEFFRKREDVVSFDELCADCVDLHMYIVTFLGILDLIKHKVLVFYLDDEETIYLTKGASLNVNS